MRFEVVRETCRQEGFRSGLPATQAPVFLGKRSAAQAEVETLSLFALTHEKLVRIARRKQEQVHSTAFLRSFAQDDKVVEVQESTAESSEETL